MVDCKRRKNFWGERTVYRRRAVDISENGRRKRLHQTGGAGLRQDERNGLCQHRRALATGWRGNFSIDNVSTFNLDLDGTAAGKVISAPVSIPHKPDDYPYEDSWDNDDLPFDGVID